MASRVSSGCVGILTVLVFDLGIVSCGQGS
jgi:hypothetical protein